MGRQAAPEGNLEPSGRSETWRNPSSWLNLPPSPRDFPSVRESPGRLLLTVVVLLVIICTSSLVTYSDLRITVGGKVFAFKEPISSVPKVDATELRQQLLSSINAALLIKTGASVLHERLSPHLITDLQNSSIPFQVYSDYEEDFQGHHVVDALEELSRREAFKDGTKLFTPYFKQKERLSQGLTSLGGRKFHDLDSFKFIPMEMDGVQRFPDAEWYIHIDADSYILLSNLAKYLKTLNSNAHHYLGHIAWLGHVPFAHGGSGYVLSQRLIQEAFVQHADLARSSAIKLPMEAYCCGEVALAKLLYGYDGSPITSPRENTSVSFNGATPETLQFQGHSLCKPVFSLHHVPNKYNHAKLWEFEQKILLQLSEQQMATYSDLLWHFAPPFLRKALESGTQKEIMLQGWDTTARGVALPALSPRVCSQQCDRKTDCVAWVMTGKNKCYLESHMRIGMASTFGVTSGWRMDRFSKVWEDRSCRVSDSAP